MSFLDNMLKPGTLVPGKLRDVLSDINSKTGFLSSQE